MSLSRSFVRHLRRVVLSTRRFTSTEGERTLKDVAEHEENISKRLFETFLKLEQIDTNIFRAHHLLRGRKSLPAVYGGQVVGQALSAANCTVNESYIPHSLHSYFIKSGTVTKPILYTIDRTRDGRSFCTRNVKAIQDGEVLFTAQISYHKLEKDSVKHTLDPPESLKKGPETLLNDRELIKAELAADEEKPEEEQMDLFHKTVLQYKMMDMPPTFHKIFESRPVNQEIYKFKPDAKPSSSMWIRAVEPIGGNFNLQRALAAYISDAHLLESALIPHVGRGVVPSMVFSLDHALWFHRPTFHVDDWMLYESFSTWAGGSRAFTHGRLWTRTGELVLSCTQEGLVRSH